MVIPDGKISLDDLNRADLTAFVETCGPLFEHSPWIGERTWAKRPFASLDALHTALMATLRHSTIEEQNGLIAAHPDLVGRMAREGRLTRESTGEQSAAGLIDLTD